MSLSQAGPAELAGDMPSYTPSKNNNNSNSNSNLPPAFQNKEKKGDRDDGIELYLVISPPDRGHYWQWSVSVYSWRKRAWTSWHVLQEPGVPEGAPVIEHYCDPRSYPGCRAMRAFGNAPESSGPDLLHSKTVAIAEMMPRGGGGGIDLDAESKSYEFAVGLARRLADRGHCSAEGVDEAENGLRQYVGPQVLDVGRPRERLE